MLTGYHNHGLDVVTGGTNDRGELFIAWPTRKQSGIMESHRPVPSDQLSPSQFYFLGFQSSPNALPPRDQAFQSICINVLFYHLVRQYLGPNVLIKTRGQQYSTALSIMAKAWFLLLISIFSTTTEAENHFMSLRNHCFYYGWPVSPHCRWTAMIAPLFDFLVVTPLCVILSPCRWAQPSVLRDRLNEGWQFVLQRLVYKGWASTLSLCLISNLIRQSATVCYCF